MTSDMRTEQQISTDVSSAMKRSDLQTLENLVEEAESLGTERALCIAFNGRGTIAQLRSENEEALVWFGRSIEMCARTGNSFMHSNVLNNMSTVHRIVGNMNEAQVCLNKALEMATGNHDEPTQALVCGNLGVLMASSGDYAKALEFMVRGLEIEERLEDKESVATSLGNLGVVSYHMGDFVTSLEFHQRALEESILQNMAGMSATSTGNIGTAYVGIGDHATAIEYFTRAIPMHEATGNRSSVARVTANLGIALLATGNVEQARDHFVSAFSLHKELGNASEIFTTAAKVITAELRLGSLDAAQAIIAELEHRAAPNPLSKALFTAAIGAAQTTDGNTEGALRSFEDALGIAREIAATEVIAMLHESLRDLAKTRSDFEGYIYHNTEFLQLSEQLRGRVTTTRIANMEAERKMASEREERRREQAVLYSTLPRSVADRVIRGENVKADHFDQVAVMFLDLVGFTTLSASLEPLLVVEMLERIFGVCDEVIKTHGMMKIKTIGDSYMAASFNNIENAALAALDLVESITEVQIRIGIHCGPVVAGVLGKERMQYDVWGDTVNIASRMESTSEPGKIHISHSFATAITGEQGVRCVERGEVDIKGKGKMTTYWLEKM